MKVFRFNHDKAAHYTLTIHEEGQCIVFSGAKEVVEFKKEQLDTCHQKFANGNSIGPLDSYIESD